MGGAMIKESERCALRLMAGAMLIAAAGGIVLNTSVALERVAR